MAKLFSMAAYGYTLLVVIASLGKFVIGIFPQGIEHSDKLAHFVAYAGLVIVWLFFFLKVKKYLFRKSVWIVFFGSVFFGILMEFCQWGFTSYRQFDYYDMLANTLGSAIGLLIFCAFFCFYKKKTTLDF